MKGNLPGGQVVDVQNEPGPRAGIIRNHLLSTGLENVFEGVTIATLQGAGDNAATIVHDAASENEEHAPKTARTDGARPALEPLIYGSADNLVAAFYDQNGRRAILDGGFTRLYVSWNDAGTPRYVKNAAAWLANYERFGDAIVSDRVVRKDL